MNKLFLATTVLAVWSGSAFADCSGPPYGSKMDRYNRYMEMVERGKLNNLALEQFLKRVCLGKQEPGEYRDALHTLGFSDDVIDVTDSVLLAEKVLLVIANMPREK